MTQSDTTAGARGGSRPAVRYRGRHLPMVAVIVAATIATALAYSGMVLFGLEVAGMSPAEAYALAGFLEVSLVAVALMARNAALEGRPYGVLLTLTWVLSGTSGMFAALHEIAVPDASTPYMVAFRFVPPLVAALMWHLALVGERHMVTGHTLDERRRERRVHQYVTALERWRDARLDSSGTRRGMRRVRTAHRRQRAARDGALKLLTVEDFVRRMQVWVERLEAAEQHGNRLDLIGASSVERGVVRGAALGAVREVPALAAVPSGALSPEREPVRSAPELDAAPGGEVVPAAEDVPSPVELSPVEPVERPADESSDGPFADEFQAALTGDTPVVRADDGMNDSTSEGMDDGLDDPAEQSAAEREAEAGLPGTREPLPETGHTRRVEVFDLLRQTDPAMGGALAHRSAFLTAHGAGDEKDVEAQPAAEPHAAATSSYLALDHDLDHDQDPYPEPENDRDRRIVELASAGLSQREIADRVDVSRATVGRVVKRYAPA